MGRILGGSGLLLVAAFMLLGFLRADVSASGLAVAVAFLLAVALPAGAGVALIRGETGGGGRLTRRRDQLRRQTLESEVLRLAGRREGKLTVIEVMAELAVPAEEAKDALDALMTREIAELEIAESGMLVYAFRDIRALPEKERARGLLE